jgi:glycosyltransferase involved in cell wall biosynthesis
MEVFSTQQKKTEFKISVILSLYNGEKYIIEQLDSIRKQTLQPDEVIIRDDCSKDKSFDIVKEYIEKYQLSKWKLASSSINEGWRNNFFTLFSLTTGDITFLSDQDDIWFPNKIEKMSKCFVDHPEIQLLMSDYIEIIESGGRSLPLRKYKYKTKDHTHWIKIQKKVFWGLRPGCTFAVNKDFLQYFKSISGRNEDLTHDGALFALAYITGVLYNYPFATMCWRKSGNSSFVKESHGYLMRLKRFFHNYVCMYSFCVNLISNNDAITSLTENTDTKGALLRAKAYMRESHFAEDAITTKKYYKLLMVPQCFLLITEFINNFLFSGRLQSEGVK